MRNGALRVGVALLGLLPSALAAEGAQDPGSEAHALFQAGRYGAAWTVAGGIADPVERARRQLDAAFWAGSLEGGLEAAARGLALAPGDTWLLYYGTDLALQLGALERGGRWLDGLRVAVEEDPDLSEVQRTWYHARLESLSEDLSARTRSRQERERCERRARWTSLLLVLLVGGAATLLVRDGRAG